jgi:hypothetical protein
MMVCTLATDGELLDGEAGTVIVNPAALDPVASRLLSPSPPYIFVAGQLTTLWVETADRYGLPAFYCLQLSPSS